MNPTTDAELDARITAHFAATPKEPLMLFGLSEQLYRKARGENVSALKPLAESPKKYRYHQDNPREQTAAMIFGTIVHALLLEPATVPGMIVTRPSEWKDWRTNAAKEWREKQTALVVSDDEMLEMKACADEVRRHPKAGWILDRAEKEVAVWKIHQRTGLLLKGRIDLPFQDLQNKTAVADIKKVASVKQSLFEKAIGERLYQMQGAFYCDLLGATSFYFIAVEENAPNEVDIFELEPEGEGSLAEGRRLYEALLDRLATCRIENRWPGIGEDSETIRRVKAPRWSYTADTIET